MGKNIPERRLQMRRKDREITEADRVDEVVRSCDCCRVGFADEGAAYIVPLNFGFSAAGGERFFYFHGAAEGKKMDLIRKKPGVGFELDTGTGSPSPKKAAGVSFRFQSVIGRGKAAVVEGRTKSSRRCGFLWSITAAERTGASTKNVLRHTAVWKLTVEEISCKEHD
jgi:nitroimidazol reductase NimA-like FMN-containing flavoprotein (pyridoxamine 5'-phosphate oxidase superfamily)